MLELIEVTKWELSERASKPRGLLRIAAPAPMASGTFPDLLAEFMGYYPEVNIALLLANSVDLVDDAIDVQLSIGPIEDVNFIVRRLSLLRMVVCASPPYWEKHGKPQRPDELGSHDALTLVRSGINPAWHFVVDGEVPRLRSTLV